MEIFDAATPSFAETVAERLFVAERRLREAVQHHERAPVHQRHATPVQLSLLDARTILRAVLPATMALGRTRRATLELHGAVSSLYAALVDMRDPTLLDPAIDAALNLAAVLADWLDEARWRQATRKAGHRASGWARPISTLLRQSSVADAERIASKAPPPLAAGPPKRQRQNVPGQTTLILPIAGGRPAQDEETPCPASRRSMPS